MEETRYIISDAAKKLEVEPHVLRYWEEELEMEIPRNDMGHRYYRENEIRTLKAVQELKNNGFQLRAIKMVLPEILRNENFDVSKLISLKEDFNKKVEELEKNTSFSEQKQQEVTIKAQDNSIQAEATEDKMYQFQTIMNKIMENALKNNNSMLGQVVSEHISERIMKELDYLFRIREEQEEERFKKFDENMREYQRARAEIAITDEHGKKRRKRFRSGK